MVHPPRNSFNPNKTMETWKPQSPPATAADLPRLCALHRVVVLHCWAIWDRHDIGMDERLQPIRDDFAPSIGVYSLDIDDKANWDFVIGAAIGNIPALVCLTKGVRQETLIGGHPTNTIRAKFQEWLAKADAATGSAEKMGD